MDSTILIYMEKEESKKINIIFFFFFCYRTIIVIYDFHLSSQCVYLSIDFWL